MDDRAVSILDQYEFKVLRTWKGRGAILCETNQGLKILKEYAGPKEKVILQNKLLQTIQEKGFQKVEQIIENKENELITVDADQKPYIVKDYFEGKECNVKEEEECVLAVKQLAKLHKVMEMEDSPLLSAIPIFSLEREYDKHNKELKKVKNYMRQKSQKTDFEVYLMKYYDSFYYLAMYVQEELEKIDFTKLSAHIMSRGTLCHGDYQYHNILFMNNEIAIINFEKYILDSKVRDLYLFMRKVLEKNEWSERLGQLLLQAYEKECPLMQEEYKQLYYRFLYPEKFWKIVNFYFNSGKAFISCRNMEKLQKLLKSQQDMQNFIQSLKNMI